MIHFRHNTRLTRVGGNYQDEVSAARFREAEPFTGTIPSPTPLRFQTTVEGVDDPFRTRWRVATGQERRKPQRDWRVLVSGGEVISIPTPIFSLPADELPLRVGRFGEIARGNWKRKLDALELARRSGPTRNITFFATAPAPDYAGTACGMFAEIQRHLLEDPVDNGLNWTIWSFAEVVSSINDRLNRFNQLTGIIRSRATLSFVPGQPESSDLPADFLQLRRAVWNTGTSKGILPIEDKYELDYSTPGWETVTGEPKVIVKEPLERLTVRLHPTPTLAGTVEIVYIPKLTAPIDIVDGQVVCGPLPIPAVFQPFIKWGILADLLSKEGEANEPERAQYAEQRFAEGVELARAMLGTVS